MKANLGDHPNVFSTCIEILNIQGWKIEIIPEPYENEDKLYSHIIATRNKTQIYAADPLKLLGLAAIDNFNQPHGEKPYWWSIKGNLYEQLKDEALEKSFLTFKKNNPDKWKNIIIKSIREHKNFNNVYEDIGISSKTFFKIIEENPDLKLILNQEE